MVKRALYKGLTKVRFLAFLPIFVAACATPGYHWEEGHTCEDKPSHIPLPYNRYPREWAPIDCKYACTRRDYIKWECKVYLPVDAPDWAIIHEKKHCAGYDHLEQ